jgi:hypothetical protein
MDMGVSTMKRGDIVRHKLADEVYRILRVGENVAVCQCPPYSCKFGWGWMFWDSYTCSIDNLELCPQGQFIFDWIDSFPKQFFPQARWEKLNEPKPGTQLSLI